MGEIEEKITKSRRLSILQKSILTIIGISGVLAVGLIFPGVATIMKYTDKGKKGSRNIFSVNRSVNNLISKGYLNFEGKDANRKLRITENGQKFLEREALLLPKRKRRWDKKWRLVIFDIKEKKKVVREKLRNTLISIGFLKLQNSVWVYPYDCEDFIKLLKADFEVGKEILYIVADEIENSNWVKSHFHIPQ